jgi:hypothetical protein
MTSENVEFKIVTRPSEYTIEITGYETYCHALITDFQCTSYGVNMEYIDFTTSKIINVDKLSTYYGDSMRRYINYIKVFKQGTNVQLNYRLDDGYSLNSAPYHDVSIVAYPIKPKTIEDYKDRLEKIKKEAGIWQRRCSTHHTAQLDEEYKSMDGIAHTASYHYKSLKETPYLCTPWEKMIYRHPLTVTRFKRGIGLWGTLYFSTHSAKFPLWCIDPSFKGYASYTGGRLKNGCVTNDRGVKYHSLVIENGYIFFSYNSCPDWSPLYWCGLLSCCRRCNDPHCTVDRVCNKYRIMFGSACKKGCAMFYPID